MEPCKYGHAYWEYIGEKWMGQCEMFECIYSGDKETADECSDKCPAYERGEETND